MPALKERDAYSRYKIAEFVNPVGTSYFQPCIIYFKLKTENCTNGTKSDQANFNKISVQIRVIRGHILFRVKAVMEEEYAVIASICLCGMWLFTNE